MDGSLQIVHIVFACHTLQWYIAVQSPVQLQLLSNVIHEVSLASCQASLTMYTRLWSCVHWRSLTVRVVPGIHEVGTRFVGKWRFRVLVAKHPSWRHFVYIAMVWSSIKCRNNSCLGLVPWMLKGIDASHCRSSRFWWSCFYIWLMSELQVS